MTKFLSLKHWQLFALFIGIPFLFQIVTLGAVTSGNDQMYLLYLFPIIMLVMTALYFGWFYALGTNLYKKMRGVERMNVSRFKTFVLIPAVYIIVICVVMSGLFFGYVPEGDLELGPMVALIILPIHLFSIYCIFYCMYFIAKVLKTVELRRPVTFSDFAGEFFMIWFFPIGIWFLQPKINAIFAAGAAGDEEKFDFEA
ncbi:hypothetical protein [Chitinophaga rhizosphaerae]|uniref:hypothetical protein n=1 Tax=Chitinophaga rhizosphaerae TaxID=1864947 RepID=UPI000F8140CF|nr:hypothetical protein [Chitinophaga rhizosphaerae]